MRSSDLVPLLTGLGGGKGVGFRQGVVVAWDPDTAENQIQVGNTVIDNLPILNTSEASLLVPGDVVGILTSGSSWAIMGRLVIPGTPEAASSIQSITNRIVASRNDETGTYAGTTWGNLAGTAVGPAVTIRVGASGRALCMWSCEIGQSGTAPFVSWMEKTTPHVGIELSGANTLEANVGSALNLNVQHPNSATSGYALTQVWLQAAMLRVYTGLDPGNTTFTMKYKTDGQLPSVAGYFQAREIAVFAL
jgi:hypothetical protein